MVESAIPRALVVLHAPEEHLGALEPSLRRAGADLTIRTMPGPLPPAAGDEGLGGLVVMGGSMGVYEADAHPFLESEMLLISDALRASCPVLGVCLGSQLLAAAAGARVYPGPETEVGWLPVRLVDRDSWRETWPATFEPFHWHGDTFDLPFGARLLASTDSSPHQASRVGSGLGLQFHVEATAQMVSEWASAPGLGERWRLTSAQLERTATAATAMGPLVDSLAKAFCRAAFEAHRRLYEPART